jgi:hypothetical protein
MNCTVERVAAGCVALAATFATVWSVAIAAYPEVPAKAIAPHASAPLVCRPG